MHATWKDGPFISTVRNVQINTELLKKKEKNLHSVGYFTFASWEPLSNGSLRSPTPFGETHPEHWARVCQKNVPHCPWKLRCVSLVQLVNDSPFWLKHPIPFHQSCLSRLSVSERWLPSLSTQTPTGSPETDPGPPLHLWFPGDPFPPLPSKRKGWVVRGGETPLGMGCWGLKY